MPSETGIEKRVWELLTHSFRWRPSPDFPVRLLGSAEGKAERLQVFEVATALVFAQLRPEYEWYVTPDRPDGGLDFVGEQAFLEDATLGIAAAITVGGQCKKRSRVDDVVGEVAGSLARMAETVDPTFFVVAFSAHIEASRVADARRILERVHQRHCHILDRPQIEGLLSRHLAVVDPVVQQALKPADARLVTRYLASVSPAAPAVSVDVQRPVRVLAGVPFRLTVTVRSVDASSPDVRMSWGAPDTSKEGSPDVWLIAPVDADTASGVELGSGSQPDPVTARHDLELITYFVGTVPLGEVRIVSSQGLSPQTVTLGEVESVENVAPRFYERPFRAALQQLSSQYDRALAGTVAAVGVVGAGGSGKSRLAMEFSLGRRREGAKVVAARHAKTLSDPHRILAELLAGLVGLDDVTEDPAEFVALAVARYDRALADRARPAIQSIFGGEITMAARIDRQSLVSCLLVLVAADARERPLILHLQDLHWATADTLILIERLIWQIEQTRVRARPVRNAADTGVLFILEGRIREQQNSDDDGWVSEPFELFLQTLDAPLARCSSFNPDDGLVFVRRLFEDRHSAGRLNEPDLLPLQQTLIGEIDRAAGGNPFHTLEQIQLLKAQGVLRQNRQTGLLFLAQPPPDRQSVPESVFDAISLRWNYLRTHQPDIAELVWAASLLDDRLPAMLFRRLWQSLAPAVSLNAIDATEMLWVSGRDGDDLGDVTFRHENYFRSIRRFGSSAEARRRVVAVYSEWFEAAQHRDPRDELRWARILLECPDSDGSEVRARLQSGLDGATRDGDEQLARTIEGLSLDLAWEQNTRSQLSWIEFVARVDGEIVLIRRSLDTDRAQARRRLARLSATLATRRDRGSDAQALLELERRSLTVEVLRSQLLFNDGQVATASDVADAVVTELDVLRAGIRPERDRAWDELDMEALHSQAVALALSGEVDQALRVSGLAVEIAWRLPSAMATRFIVIHANMLLARDPLQSESMLSRLLGQLAAAPEGEDARHLLEVNLGMALLVNAAANDAHADSARIERARSLLSEVFTRTFRIGRYANAAAAALLLGIVSAVEGDRREVWWFAQSVAAASRGSKRETLWRAHANLAGGLRRQEGEVSDAVREHARAALEILDDSLMPYADAGASTRFALVRSPLAQCVSLLLEAGEHAGRDALIRHPALRLAFDDVRTGRLRDDRGGPRSHEWIRVDGFDYVIY